MQTPTVHEVPRVRHYGNADTPRKPSARQVYAMAHLALDLMGLDWPTDRASASTVIQTLSAQAAALAGADLPLGDEALATTAAGDEVPF